nr:MAG TPA: hypothetical protein [Caudoviricetes sp.]
MNPYFFIRASPNFGGFHHLSPFGCELSRQPGSSSQ